MSNADEEKEKIKAGVSALADCVFRLQSSQGIWPADGDVDMPVFFADLHSKLASAYEESKEKDPTAVTWVNPETGEEAPAGQGIPDGLMVTMAEITFSVLGFYRAIGLDPGALLADLGVTFEDGAEVQGDVSGALDMAGEEDGDSDGGGGGDAK